MLHVCMRKLPYTYQNVYDKIMEEFMRLLRFTYIHLFRFFVDLLHVLFQFLFISISLSS